MPESNPNSQMPSGFRGLNPRDYDSINEFASNGGEITTEVLAHYKLLPQQIGDNIKADLYIKNLLIGIRESDSKKLIRNLSSQVLAIDDKGDGSLELEEALRAPSIEYFNLPDKDYPSFIGRQDKFNQVIEGLSPSIQSFIISIDGLGGIGKTTLAFEVAYFFMEKHADLPIERRFDAVIWVSAQDRVVIEDKIVQRHPSRVSDTLEKICNGILMGFDRLNLLGPEHADNRVSLARELLSRYKTLLIIDNLENVADPTLESFLYQMPRPSKVIVTTRHRINNSLPVRIEKMSIEECISLIDQEWAKKPRTIELTYKQKLDLYELTDGLPIAIKWILPQISRDGPDRVFTEFSERTKGIAEYCFDMSFKRLKRGRLDVLTVIALSPRSVHRTQIGKILGISDGGYRDDCLNELEDLSFINRDTDTGDFYSVLPITREYVTQKRTVEDLRNLKIRCESSRGEMYGLRLQAGLDSYTEGNYSNAQLLLEECLEIANELENRELLIEPLTYLRKIAYTQWKLDKAYTLNEQLLKIYEENGSPLEQSFAYDQFGLILVRRGELEQGKEMLMKSLQIKRAEGLLKHTPYTLNALAELYLRREDYDNAEELVDESIRIARNLDDRGRLSHAYKVRGKVHFNKKNLKEADKSLTMALMYYKQQEDRKGLVDTLVTLAQICKVRNRAEEEREYLEEALQVSEDINHKPTVVYCLSSLGQHSFRQRDVQLAIDYLERALNLSQDLGSPRTRMMTLRYLVEAYMTSGEVERSYDILIELIALADDLGSPKVKLYALDRLASLYRRVEPEKSRTLILGAVALCQELGRTGQMLGLLSRLMDIAEDMINYEEMLEVGLKGTELAREVGREKIEIVFIIGTAKAYQYVGDMLKATVLYREAYKRSNDQGQDNEAIRSYGLLMNLILVQEGLDAAIALFEEEGGSMTAHHRSEVVRKLSEYCQDKMDDDQVYFQLNTSIRYFDYTVKVAWNEISSALLKDAEEMYNPRDYLVAIWLIEKSFLMARAKARSKIIDKLQNMIEDSSAEVRPEMQAALQTLYQRLKSQES